MAIVASGIKYAFLDSFARKAGLAGVRLLVAIESAIDSAVTGIEGGMILIGVSGNGSSVTMQAPRSFDSADLCGFLGQLKQDYVSAKTKLIDAGTASPTDAQILTEMQSKCIPIRRFQTDFSQLTR